MSQTCVRTPIGTGIHLTAISDSKFKHNRLSINFVLPLDRDRASDHAAVPHILRMGCRTLPDLSSLNARLQELYGANLDASVYKFGGYQVMELSIRGLDNRYALEGEDITAQCAQLLAQIALDPKLDGDGLFYETDTALQRRFIQDAIEAEINEKRSYAISQCLQTMCEGEPVAVKTYGYPETAAAITAKSATAAYRHMLKNAPIEVIFTGAGDAQIAGKILSKAFAGQQRTPFDYSAVRLGPVAGAVREKTEEMDIAQGKLVLGLRCQGLETPRQIRAARLFSALYGGTPFSKLFRNVREKLSLCYYCASRFDSATHLLLVDSGIETANKEKAQEEILRQLEVVKSGDFTDEELAETKLLMRSSLITTTDSPSATEGWYMAQILRGQMVSPQEDADALDAITREEIVQAAQTVQLDTVYFLKGKEERQ